MKIAQNLGIRIKTRSVTVWLRDCLLRPKSHIYRVMDKFFLNLPIEMLDIDLFALLSRYNALNNKCSMVKEHI